MTIIKKYEKVDAQHEEVSFGISRMEDIYVKRNGAADEPHRHAYYTVLVVKQAKGIHKIDFQSYSLAEKQIFFVAPGQVHQVIESEKSYGYALTFSTQFLIKHNIRLSFIEQLHLFRTYGESPPLEPSESRFEKIHEYASEIFSRYHGETSWKMHSIGAFLKLLLIECNEVCSLQVVESGVDLSGGSVIREFKSLVSEHHRQEHSTTYYADRLHITADHLNRTVKAKLGRTAKEYIQSRITSIVAYRCIRIDIFADVAFKGSFRT